MMQPWGIIPVKALPQTKSRLATVLDGPERAALTRALLRRTIGVLTAVSGVAGVVIVSRDEQVAAIGRDHGLPVVAERQGAGLNGAVRSGVDFVRDRGGSHALVLPSDLPLLTAGDVAQMIQVGGTAVEPTLVICGDEQQMGTNGLLLPAQVPFRFWYGADSFRRHVREARRRGLAVTAVACASIQFDLDTQQDWQWWQQHVESRTLGEAACFSAG